MSEPETPKYKLQISSHNLTGPETEDPQQDLEAERQRQLEALDEITTEMLEDDPAGPGWPEEEYPGPVSTWPDGQDPRWWTIKDASETFGTSAKTIRRRIKDGKVVSQRDQATGASRWLVREDSLIQQFGPPREIPVQPGLQPPAAIELKELIDGYRELMHDLQDAYKDAAIAAAKAEHMGERVVEVRADRDQLREERDRLVAEMAEIRNRRWWQRKK